jgi:hypothetical protein
MIRLLAASSRNVTFSEVTITSEFAETDVVFSLSPFKSLLSCMEEEVTAVPLVPVGGSNTAKFVGLTEVVAVGLVPALLIISFNRATANRALRCASA